jgi:hypothetical protein
VYVCRTKRFFCPATRTHNIRRINEPAYWLGSKPRISKPSILIFPI